MEARQIPLQGLRGRSVGCRSSEVDRVDQTEVGDNKDRGQPGSRNEGEGVDWKLVRWPEGRKREMGASEHAGSAAEGCGPAEGWRAEPEIGAAAQSSPAEWPRTQAVVALEGSALAASGHQVDSCPAEHEGL